MELTFTLTLILFFQETGLGNHKFPKQPIGNRASLSHSLGFVGIFVSPLIFRKPIYGFLFHSKYLGNPLSANALRFSILFPQYGNQYFESLQIAWIFARTWPYIHIFMTTCSFTTIKYIESIISIYSSTHLFSSIEWKITTPWVLNLMTICSFVTIKSIKSVISIYWKNCVEN